MKTPVPSCYSEEDVSQSTHVISAIFIILNKNTHVWQLWTQIVYFLKNTVAWKPDKKKKRNEKKNSLKRYSTDNKT